MVDLPIDRSVTPVCQPYRRIPIALEQKVDDKIQELLDQGIIEPVQSFSRWVSPLVIIAKENGDIRLCVDMRRANEAIIRENHPIPTLEEILPQLRNASIFTKLDIRNAFHQVEISPESRDITTFICKRGLFRYRRLMFGISCAPEIFQKVIEKLLAGCTGYVVYIDDILIFGETEDIHNSRVNDVWQRLNRAGVVLNEEKIIRNVTELEFLGHFISQNGIKPSEDKIKDLLKCRQPTTAEEMRSFLGLLNFIGKFIPNLSTLAEPLYRISKASSHFVWTSEQTRAFDSIMGHLRNVTFLKFFDPKLDTFLMTDASPVGMGAVLFQGSRENPSIISFASKTLSDVERRYSQTEKEALGIVWGIERFHIYLYGIKFILLSDHKPLQFIFSLRSKPCARIERWVLRLMPYRYQVLYIPGKENIADSLSRLSITSTENLSSSSEEQINQIIDATIPSSLSKNEIISATESDEEIQTVFRALRDGKWSKNEMNYRLFESELSEVDGILLRGTRIVVPQTLRKNVLGLAHEGHPGMSQTKMRLRMHVWWPKMDTDVDSYVKNCRGCQLVTLDVHPEPMKRRTMPDKPWTDLAIDYLGPLPTNHYLFVVVDYFSRYFEVVVTKSIDTSSAIASLREIFSRFGIPRSITADHGPQFRSIEFSEFCRSCQIRLILTTPYWPQHNGEVERQNRSILKRLIISQNTGKDWRSELIDFLLMYRSTPHTILKKTPSELMFGWNIKDKLPRLTQDGEFEHEGVRECDKIEKEKGKLYADRKRRAVECDLDVGDQVLIRNQHKENKLSPAFENIDYRIVDVQKGSILVEHPETGRKYLRNPAHVKKTNVREHITENREVLEDMDDDEQEQINEDHQSQEQDPNSHFGASEVQGASKPSRTRRVPKHLEDYDLLGGK